MECGGCGGVWRSVVVVMVLVCGGAWLCDGVWSLVALVALVAVAVVVCGGEGCPESILASRLAFVVLGCACQAGITIPTSVSYPLSKPCRPHIPYTSGAVHVGDGLNFKFSAALLG